MIKGMLFLLGFVGFILFIVFLFTDTLSYLLLSVIFLSIWYIGELKDVQK